MNPRRLRGGVPDPVRHWLERASRRVVLRRRLPPDLGAEVVYLSPGAMLRYWRRDLEAADPMLISMAREIVHPGDVVWDIGANVGTFATAAAHRAGPAGRVVAIEADAWLVGLLRRTAGHLSGCSAPMETIGAAVSDRVGLATFAIAARSRAANHLQGHGEWTQAGGVREEQTVVTITLDMLLAQRPPPQVIKIDVEGAEAAVLAGAATLLQAHAPVILIEVWARNRRAVDDILRQHGYALFDAEEPPPRTRLTEPVNNTLAVPAPDRQSNSSAVSVGPIM